MVAVPGPVAPGLNRGRRVFLTGFMGAGKSVIGQSLARKMDWDFVDLDDAIVETTGRTIPDLFEQGEETFRHAETADLRKVLDRDRVVVALGGGTLNREDNLDLVRRSGILVYLRAGVDSLFRRLERTVSRRPMLGGRTGALLRSHIEELLMVRRPYYEAADITIDASDARGVEAIAEELADALSNRLSADLR